MARIPATQGGPEPYATAGSDLFIPIGKPTSDPGDRRPVAPDSGLHGVDAPRPMPQSPYRLPPVPAGRPLSSGDGGFPR